VSHIAKRSIQILKEEGIESFIRRSTKFAHYLSIKGIRVPYFYYQDLRNKIIYGVDAPIRAERIWINPADIDMALIGLYSWVYSGRVVNTWPPNNIQPIPIMNLEKLRCCVDHFTNGVAWEDTGIYEHMTRKMIEWGGSYDGCTNQEDVISRYERMDALFDQIKRERRIRTRKEINPRNFRESGGIYVHIGPSGKLFFGAEGCHRFAIARILELPVVPAQIGCVYECAIPHLRALRQKNHTER
jgi:hypothetical protein